MPGNKCTNCITFKTQCTHLYISKDSSSSLNYRNSREHVAAILSTTTTYVPSSDPVVLYNILVDIAKYARNLEEVVADCSAISSLQTRGSVFPEENNFPTTPKREGDDLSDDGVFVDSSIIDPLRQLALRLPISGADENSRFYGKSSSMHFMKAAMEYVDNPGSTYTFDAQRPEFWTVQPWQRHPFEAPPPQVFPDEDLLKTLIDIYFRQINPIVFILHSPSFRASVADGVHLRNHYFGAVVLVVCALAARFSDDPRVLITEGASQHSAGWKWFQQARPLQLATSANTEPSPSLYKLQLISLSVLFFGGTSTPRDCWILAGLGIRVAQEMGAHRRSRYTTCSRTEAELLKRAFWVLIATDTIMSSLFGRPTITTSEDFDVDLPTDCDEEYWNEPYFFQQPTHKPSLAAYVTSYLKLMVIFNRAQRAIYPVKKQKECEPEVIVELDSDLNKWLESIPAHLRWDPNREGTFLNQSASLYVTYYHVQILIHRPFIPASDTTAVAASAFPSLAICANAARSCGHVMEVQSRRRDVLYHPQAITALSDSAVILLLNVWGGRRGKLSPSDIARAVTDIKKCVDVLHLYEKRWPVAGRKCDMITEMLNRGSDVPPTSSLAPSLKRTRSVEGANADDNIESRAPAARLPPATAAQQLEQLELSIQQTDHLFSLPFSTQELGLLPVYESFDFQYDFQHHPAPTSGLRYSPPEGSYGTDQHISTEPDQDTNLQYAGPQAGYSWEDWTRYARYAEDRLF